jgi:hypothetical protein
MKGKKCDSCNSEIITYREGGRLVAECSYCGKPVESGEIESFMFDDEADE